MSNVSVDASRPPPKPPAHSTQKGRMWRGLVILALLVVVVLAIYHLFGNRKAQQRGAVPQRVTVAAATLGEMPETLSELGTVTPVATVTVLPQLSGYLTAVGYREGQDVEKGQFLAQIDARQYEISKQQAEAQLAKDQAVLDQARADMARYTQLNATRSIAAQTYADQQFTVQQSEAAVKADRANIAQYALDIAYCHITAPVAGRIGLRLVDPGNYVTASSQPGIAVITTMKPTTVQFTVPQNTLARVLKRFNSGAQLPVIAYSSDNTRQLASGTLYAINNQMATSTGTVTLRAMFPNDDEALFPNEFVNVKLLVDTQHDVVLVPTSAVQSGAPGDFVYLVNANGPDNTTVSIRKVTLGPSDGLHTVVVTGLNVGDKVVIDGTDRLSDKAKIHPVERQASAGASHGAPGEQGAAPGDGSGRTQGPPAELSDAIGVSDRKGRGQHRHALPSPEAALPFAASQVPAALPGVAASGAQGGRPLPVRDAEPAPMSSAPRIPKNVPVAANGSVDGVGDANGANGVNGAQQQAERRRPEAERVARVTPPPAASRMVAAPAAVTNEAGNNGNNGTDNTANETGDRAPDGVLIHRRPAAERVSRKAPAPAASQVVATPVAAVNGPVGPAGVHQGAHRVAPTRVAAASASGVPHVSHVASPAASRMLAVVVAAANDVQQELARRPARAAATRVATAPAAARVAAPVAVANGMNGANGFGAANGARQGAERRSVAERGATAGVSAPVAVAGANGFSAVNGARQGAERRSVAERGATAGVSAPVAVAANGAGGANGTQQEPGRRPVAGRAFHAAPVTTAASHGNGGNGDKGGNGADAVNAGQTGEQGSVQASAQNRRAQQRQRSPVRTVSAYVPVLAAPQGTVALSATSPMPVRASGAVQVPTALQTLGTPPAMTEDDTLHLSAPAPAPAPDVVQTSTQAW